MPFYAQLFPFFLFLYTNIESLVDLEGLLGYCQEKIKLGHFCLYCEKVFPTWQGCQNHMTSKQHTKLRYEKGYWDELDPFYDFKADNEQYETTAQAESKTNDIDVDMGVADKDDDDEDSFHGIELMIYQQLILWLMFSRMFVEVMQRMQLVLLVVLVVVFR